MALSATNTAFGNIIKWGAPSQDDVAYFKVYRRTDASTPLTTDKIAEVGWSKTPHFIDVFPNLNQTAAYNYYVKAISWGDKSSAASAKISASHTTVTTFSPSTGGWVSCAITAGGTTITTYTASGDTSILNLALHVTAASSVDGCTVAISGGGTEFLAATKTTAVATLWGSGVITLSSAGTISVAMTATTSDQIAGALKIHRIIF